MQIRSVVPEDEWPQTATALARLQSITRVELSQQADVAAAALELANSAKVLPPDDTVDSGTELPVLSSADIEDGSGAAPPLKPLPDPTGSAEDSREDIDVASGSQSRTGSSSRGTSGPSTPSGASAGSQDQAAGGANAATSSAGKGDIISSAWTAATGAVRPVAQACGGAGSKELAVGTPTQMTNFATNVLETVDLEDEATAPLPLVPNVIQSGSTDSVSYTHLTLPTILLV